MVGHCMGMTNSKTLKNKFKKKVEKKYGQKFKSTQRDVDRS